MKFGKQLAKVVALSDPEWSPFWVSYKSLKKRVKDLTDAQNQAQRQAAAQQKQQQGGGVGGVNKMETDANSAVVQELSQKAGEVNFFRTIRAEVQKASEFYNGMEQQMSARRKRIKLGIQYLKQPSSVLEDDAWIKMRRACISLYKDLLLLENFAVMNYCACSKALKKHDKTVSLETRGHFMRNVVNQQPFTHYPRLLEMLQEMEHTFSEIDALQGESARPLEEEERLFLEAIRGLNQEASSMQREEKADLGVSPAPEADDQMGGLCGKNENAIAQAKKGAAGAGAAGKSKGARGAGEENNGAELEDMPQEGTPLEERSGLMAKLGDQPHRGEAKRRKLN